MRRLGRVVAILLLCLSAFAPLSARAASGSIGISPTIGGCAIDSAFGSVTPAVGGLPVSDSYQFTGSLTCETLPLVGVNFSGSMSCTTDTIAACLPYLAVTVTVTFSTGQSMTCAGEGSHLGLFYSIACSTAGSTPLSITALSGSLIFSPNTIPMTTYQIVGTLELGGAST